MEKGIKTFQDNKSLFNHDNFYILDCDGNKIYFGLAKNKKDQIYQCLTNELIKKFSSLLNCQKLGVWCIQQIHLVN